jgi:Leucine-rich repeat (LRR) protein
MPQSHHLISPANLHHHKRVVPYIRQIFIIMNMNERDGDDSLADMQRMNVHDYGGSDTIVQERSGWSQRSKRRCLYLSVIGLLVFIITLSVKVSQKNESSAPSDGLRIPAPEVKTTVQDTNGNELGDFLVEVYQKLGLSTDSWSVEGSPQNLALKWIAGREEYTSYAGPQKIQRYALACFYYSTFLKPHTFLTSPTGWTSQEKWITDESECAWEGIACNTDGQVISILLPKHSLSGSFPMEVALLTNLLELDITSNSVYMEGDMHAVWKHMGQVKKLILEDNFFVTTTGLPTEFAGLSSLERLQMSYNLLQGELTEDVFKGMQKLQYLEFESNYVKGDFPSSMGALPDLQYIYVRRNEMSISLDDMMVIPGSYPSIFSLWLDNNIVTTTIPTQIGNFVALASFSMTNVTAKGPIPTQIGLLTDLQRVWLYDNELSGKLPTELGQLKYLEVFEIYDNALTGSVPASICSSVAASTYDLRALTADCDQITCDSCCTQCYPQ